MHQRDNTHIIDCINAIADEMDAMPIMRYPGESKSPEEHVQWMNDFDRITAKMHEAEGYALLAIPQPVKAALERVNNRNCVLKNENPFDEVEPQPSQATH